MAIKEINLEKPFGFMLVLFSVIFYLR